MQDNIEPKVIKFAHTKYGEIISINDAKSGLNGYYCIGCGAEMVARKGQKNYPHLFAHHATETEKHLEKCLKIIETAIHKLAKDILQISKKIKVGNVYLDIPKEFGGGKSLLQKDRYIEAANVLIEASIYENELGEVVVGKDIDDKKYVSIKPDITFLDSDNKPILLIEIYKTHKIDTEKEAKIRRLGINTIEVRIPHISDKQELNDIFHISKHTYWIYNYEKATTIYNANTHKPIQRDSIIIDNETEFSYEEAFDCRSFRIKDAIRGLRNFIQGSQFRETETNLRNEIDRVEDNTKRFSEELRERNNRARTEADTRVDRTEERNLAEVNRQYRVQRGVKGFAERLKEYPNHSIKLLETFSVEAHLLYNAIPNFFVNNYILTKEEKIFIKNEFNQALEDSNDELLRILAFVVFCSKIKDKNQLKKYLDTRLLFAILSLQKNRIIGSGVKTMIQVAHNVTPAISSDGKAENFWVYLKALNYYKTKNSQGLEITWFKKLISEEDATKKFQIKLEKYEKNKPQILTIPQYVRDIFPELLGIKFEMKFGKIKKG